MTIKGIDVSSYQATDYSTAGLSFVGIKVTEGLSYVNPHWAGQRATARTAGLVTIFYHYPHIANSATAEADYFLSQIKLAPGDVLALDWEWYGQNVTDQQARAYKTAWLAHVKAKAPGHRVIMYCDRSVWTTVDTDSNAGDGLWIADYVAAGKPRIKAKWLFHQYSSNPVDQDVASFATVADLKAWANPTAPKPPAKPKVSLAHVVAAAKRDPSASQGHTTFKAEVLVVERALQAEKLLAAQYVDGSFGSLTVNAYARWQRALGYSGSAADGIPGKTSLSKLGDKHGFTVTT
ncbi:GH25 family lysozyme [Streptomyces sp. AM6-12]|uniref:GH25 family lysozyme n=1 Tax=Streptomyces sp. AM6-12 TaxID=3345149 RepID=UPI0037BBA3D4